MEFPVDRRLVLAKLHVSGTCPLLLKDTTSLATYKDKSLFGLSSRGMRVRHGSLHDRHAAGVGS